MGKPIKMINTPRRESIPIYVASLGEKSVEMCAEVADGWLPYLFIPERADAVWGAALRKGLAKRDPALGPLEIVAGGLLAIGDDAHLLRERARPAVALYVGGMGARTRTSTTTWCAPMATATRRASSRTSTSSGKKDEAAAAVPDELLEQLTLCGDAGYIRDKVAAWRDAGVTNLNVAPVGADPAADHGPVPRDRRLTLDHPFSQHNVGLCPGVFNR